MTMDPVLFEGEESQGAQKLDVKRYVVALRKRWWLVALVFLLVTIPWTLHVKQEKLIYEASAVIRFKSFDGNDQGINESRAQELGSRSFAERVVAELGLTMTLEPGDEPLSRKAIFAEFRSGKNPLPGRYVLRFPGNNTFHLYMFDSDDEKVEHELLKGEIRNAVTTPQQANGFSFRLAENRDYYPPEVIFSIAPFRNAVESLRRRTAVNIQRSGTLMTVTLTDNDPYLVTQTVNNLASIFARESASIKRQDVSSQRRVLEEQLKLAKEELEESDSRLKEFKQRTSLSIDTALQDKITRLTEAQRREQDLRSYSIAMQDLLGRLAATKEAQPDGQTRLTRRYIFRELVANRAFEGNANMGINRQRLDDLERRYDDTVSKSSETHPRAKEYLTQIELLQEQIEKAVGLRLTQLDREIVAAQNQIAQYSARLQQMPAEEFQLTELQRDNDQKAKIYNDINAKFQNALITEKVETEAIDILDHAIEPELPINGNKKAKAAGGAVGGLFLGILAVLALEMFDRSIKTIDDVQLGLRINALGTIPQIDFAESFEFQDGEKAKIIDQQLVTHDYSPTPIGEAYRSLRTNIMFSKSIGRIQTLCITSTSPGDGKSFTAANLAITMAQQKSNTLLVDCDLRRGVLHNTFGVPKEPGFTNFLTNNMSALEFINETHVPNLSLIGCGSLIPNPSELLGSHQMRRFLDEMRRKFDLIVFDTPPLNAATDAVVIGTQVDATLIVVRAGKTDRTVARQKLEMYQNVPAKVIGVVLNGTSVDLAHQGYSYYHY